MLDKFPQLVLDTRIGGTSYYGDDRSNCVFCVFLLFVELDDAIEGIGYLCGLSVLAIYGKKLVHYFDFVVFDVVLLTESVESFEFINGLIDFAAADEIFDIIVLHFYFGVDVFFLRLFLVYWIVVLIFFLVLVIRHNVSYIYIF